MERRLQLFLVLYIFSAEDDTFVPVPDMPADLPPQVSAAAEHLHHMISGACISASATSAALRTIQRR